MKKKELKQHREEEDARIRAFVLAHVEEQPRRLATFVARNLDAHHNHVYRELRRMVEEGLLWADGRTARRRYRLTGCGLEFRNQSRNMPTGINADDAELLTREPRNLRESERKAWLLRASRNRGLSR